MISKNEVKYIQSLSDKKNRDHHNVFIAEGPKLVTELLADGLVPQIIYTTKKLPLPGNNHFEVREVTSSELQRISRFVTSNEMTGIFYKKKLPAFYINKTFTLVLDGIQDPGNLGTIIRTADWFGITQIFASHDSVDCYNNKVVQSTMGSITRVNIYYEDIQNVLKQSEITIFGARLDGKNLYEIDKVKEGILVIGNESKGIRPDIIPFIKESVTIPRIGKAESLNAAVATGILLSHFL